MVVLSDESLYEPLENNKYMHDKMNNIRQQQIYNRPLLMAGFFELSDYGKAFCKSLHDHTDTYCNYSRKLN